MLEAQARALEQAGDNALFTRLVGADAARAIHAFGQGEFGRCADLLRRIRSGAHRFGGSHAQRDVLDQTLLEAARRGGQQALAAGLEAERAALRPRSRRLALAA